MQIIKSYREKITSCGRHLLSKHTHTHTRTHTNTHVHIHTFMYEWRVVRPSVFTKITSSNTENQLPPVADMYFRNSSRDKMTLSLGSTYSTPKRSARARAARCASTTFSSRRFVYSRSRISLGPSMSPPAIFCDARIHGVSECERGSGSAWCTYWCASEHVPCPHTTDLDSASSGTQITRNTLIALAITR